MRILHTSDWHLGHTLHDQPRDREHERFLAWLIDTLVDQRIDALLVAGDIFDSANPSSAAQATLYRFLARVLRACPKLDVVIIGGNHDSAARLSAPDPILRELNIRTVGALRRIGQEPDYASTVVPVHDQQGEVAAWIAALPYLRPADLPKLPGDGDPWLDGVRLAYAEVLAVARERRQPGQALLATGHCYMVGTKISELSERRILGGGAHALPGDIFPDDVAYVALGHLHLAQTVGSRDQVRYSGSPIPLSMAESTYRHQVCVVELDGERLVNTESLRVPRSVPLLRVPEEEPAPLAEVLELLAGLVVGDEDHDHDHDHDGLDGDDSDDPGTWPYLEVRVRLDKPQPDLRAQIEAAVESLPVRLVKLTSQYTGKQAALADQGVEAALGELEEEEVFRRCYQERYDGEPSAELMAAFSELLDDARQDQS